jgi:hypothetical protein
MQIRWIWGAVILLTLSGSAKVLGVKDFFQMTMGATLMPTILPTYVTVQHASPHYEVPNRQRRIKVYDFIIHNFDELKEEIAQADGEHLDTVGSIYELDDTQKWKSFLQAHFDDIYVEDYMLEDSAHAISDLLYDEYKLYNKAYR